MPWHVSINTTVCVLIATWLESVLLLRVMSSCPCLPSDSPSAFARRHDTNRPALPVEPGRAALRPGQRQRSGLLTRSSLTAAAR